MVEHSTRSEALTNKNWGVFIERMDKTEFTRLRRVDALLIFTLANPPEYGIYWDFHYFWMGIPRVTRDARFWRQKEKLAPKTAKRGTPVVLFPSPRTWMILVGDPAARFVFGNCEIFSRILGNISLGFQNIFTPLRVGWPPTPQVYFGPWEGLRVVWNMRSRAAQENWHT